MWMSLILSDAVSLLFPWKKLSLLLFWFWFFLNYICFFPQGEEGVVRVLQLLKEELRNAMILSGTCNGPYSPMANVHKALRLSAWKSWNRSLYDCEPSAKKKKYGKNHWKYLLRNVKQLKDWRKPLLFSQCKAIFLSSLISLGSVSSRCSEMSPCFPTESLSGEERGLIPEQRLDTEPIISLAFMHSVSFLSMCPAIMNLVYCINCYATGS